MRALLSLLLVSVLLAACGTTRIVGRAVDQNGQPLKSAQVETEPPSDYVQTGPGGVFVIQAKVEGLEIMSLPSGSYKVAVRRVGCKESRREVNVAWHQTTQLGVVRLDCREMEKLRLERVEGTENTAAPTDLGAPTKGW